MTASIAAATIVAKRHIPLARVTARSFRQHHPDIPFYVLLADELDDHFDPQKEPFKLIELEALGKSRLLPWALRYDQLPFSYALTPVLLQYLLGQFQQVIFIKQESLVLGRLESMLTGLNNASMVLTPHLLEPLLGENGLERELEILQAGSINGGIIGMRDTSITRAFLAWWEARVERHCIHDVATGVHYEQRWLDLASTLFGDTLLLRDPGCNVGHWHLPERNIRIHDGQVMANGSPCSLFRFSGYDSSQPDRATRYFTRLHISQMGDAGTVFQQYHQLLVEAGEPACREWPYAWDYFDNGWRIPEAAREMFRAEEATIAASLNPFSAKDGLLSWLQQPLAPGLTRFWHHLYQKRPDVMAAYPEPFDRDREALIGWIRNTGWQEFALTPEWIPRT